MRTARPIRPRYWLLKAGFGAALLAVFGYSLAQFRAFEAIAVHATGEVLNVSREAHATGRRGGRVSVVRPVVRFTVPGAPTALEGTAKVMSSRSFTAGERVDLAFDPRRPLETLRVASGMSALEVGFGLVGLLLLTLGAGERLRWRRQLAAAAPAAPTAARRHAQAADASEPLA